MNPGLAVNEKLAGFWIVHEFEECIDVLLLRTLPTAHRNVDILHAQRFDGSFFFSKTIKLTNRFLIETERGQVEWSAADAERIRVVDRTRPDVKFELSPARNPGAVDSFRAQIEEFCANTLHPGRISSDGPNGARSIRLIENMYRDATRLDESWQPTRV